MSYMYFLEYTRIEVPTFKSQLVQHIYSVEKIIAERALQKREYDIRKAMRHVTEKNDESNISGNDTDANDVDIRPSYDKESMAEWFKVLNSDAQLKECVECGKNDFVVDIYLSRSVFELNGRDGSDSDLEDDLFDYFSEEDSDTASVDHFSDDVRPLAKDHDFVGDQFPIYDPSIKWKLMKPVLGERTYEYGNLITSDWIARNYAKKIMINLNIKIKELVELILKKYKCKGPIEAAKEIIPLAEHRQCARHIYANFRKKFNGVIIDAHKHLMERKSESWSRAFFSTDKSCDAVENGISECFNALIVEARRLPIINMLEDIRAWQLSGIPCQHGCAAIYFLHKDPKDYISDWYGKHMFVFAYSTYIEGMNGMDQWPTTEYTKPLSLVIKRMPGRPPHKRKIDASEKDYGNRTRLRRKGVIMYCFICKKEGHTLRSGPKKGDGEGSASGSSVRGGSTSGSSVRDSKTARGGGSARGGSTSGSGSQGSASGIQGSQVFKKVNGKAVRQRGQGDGSKSSAYPHGANEISLTGTQPMASQDPIDKPVPNVPAPNELAPNEHVPNVPAPIIRRESERIKMIKFSKPVSPGPRLTPEDAMLVE
uniref:Transposase, MuDR, MULE transposase domain protein n=1 Tax=Tanacetum cinerariifolium TaxID=118510 RepID=A0A699H8G8_TANCI|nr:hypothetical protein [Tanacetum cinerariifolium]